MNTPATVISVSLLVGLLASFSLMHRLQRRSTGEWLLMLMLVEWLCCSIAVAIMGVVWHPNYHFKVRPLLFVMAGGSILLWILAGWPTMRALLRRPE